MIILGITGGVGSGKSRVLYDLKENYNAYIIEADKLAHELMQPDKSIYNEIVSTFGRSVLEEEAPYYIDREKLGSIVFNDSERLTILNGIVHPLIKKEIKRQINEVRASGKYQLFVIEAALLIQDGYNSICDEIWYIWVDAEERIRRLMKQRGYTREKCISIIDSQETDEYYKKYANYTINNQNNYENSSKQLKERLNKLLSNGIINE
ncbi:MAG: dephospho-CoA kinase [Lachnospiraceae bacterium]|nr:dephospho-CoA kinase [Lachnospiraceae bacterium]